VSGSLNHSLILRPKAWDSVYLDHLAWLACAHDVDVGPNTGQFSTTLRRTYSGRSKGTPLLPDAQDARGGRSAPLRDRECARRRSAVAATRAGQDRPVWRSGRVAGRPPRAAYRTTVAR
jgi:hypothetical protein